MEGWLQPLPTAALQQPPQYVMPHAGSLDQQYEPAEVQELSFRALRVLLGAEQLVPHSALRLAVLGSRADNHSSRRCAWARPAAPQFKLPAWPARPPPPVAQRDAAGRLPPTHPPLASPRLSSCSKCLLELAVASLVEQGLVVRQGYGPLAVLSVGARSQAAGRSLLPLLGCPSCLPQLPAAPHSQTSPPRACAHPQVPDAALAKAEALAYSEFPDEGQLPLYGSAAAAAAGLAPHHRRPGSCLNRLARRLSSPRQFGGHRPMAGVEKASARRGKRAGGGGDDISAQLQKKMRVGEGGGGGAPYSPGGLAAMSP